MSFQFGSVRIVEITFTINTQPRCKTNYHNDSNDVTCCVWHVKSFLECKKEVIFCHILPPDLLMLCILAKLIAISASLYVISFVFPILPYCLPTSKNVGLFHLNKVNLTCAFSLLESIL